MKKTKFCNCALPAITGSMDCCKGCNNNKDNAEEIVTFDSTDIKFCSYCKHYLCWINLGMWGCAKNHPLITNAEKCEDFEPIPPPVVTSTKIDLR